MNQCFKIEYIFKSDKPTYVITRQLEVGKDFELTDKSTLGGYGIKKSLTQPRALDKNGNPRFDLFIFFMENNRDIENFRAGEIVELTE